MDSHEFLFLVRQVQSDGMASIAMIHPYKLKDATQKPIPYDWRLIHDPTWKWCLPRIVIAADNLERYLHANSGDNADWPIHLKTDNEESAKLLMENLQILREALFEWREANGFDKASH